MYNELGSCEGVTLSILKLWRIQALVLSAVFVLHLLSIKMWGKGLHMKVVDQISRWKPRIPFKLAHRVSPLWEGNRFFTGSLMFLILYKQVALHVSNNQMFYGNTNVCRTRELTVVQNFKSVLTVSRPNKIYFIIFISCNCHGRQGRDTSVSQIV